MKVDYNAVWAYISLSITIITAAVMWGRIRQTIAHHTQRINEMSNSKLLTEEIYQLKNRENTMRMDALAKELQELQSDYKTDREQLRAWQMDTANTLGRIERSLEMLTTCRP